MTTYRAVESGWRSRIGQRAGDSELGPVRRNEALFRSDAHAQMQDINVTGTFIVNAHVADAINRPLNHPDGTDKHAPFWTTDEERGIIINFASAAANPYARVLSYGPTKTAVIGITKCELLPCFHRTSAMAPDALACAPGSPAFRYLFLATASALFHRRLSHPRYCRCWTPLRIIPACLILPLYRRRPQNRRDLAFFSPLSPLTSTQDDVNSLIASSPRRSPGLSDCHRHHGCQLTYSLLRLPRPLRYPRRLDLAL